MMGKSAKAEIMTFYKDPSIFTQWDQ